MVIRRQLLRVACMSAALWTLLVCAGCERKSEEAVSVPPKTAKEKAPDDGDTPETTAITATDEVPETTAITATDEDAEVDERPLGERYRQAAKHMDNGDYKSARKLLMGIQAAVKEHKIPLNRATQREIDRQLEVCEQQLRGAPPTLGEAELKRALAAREAYIAAEDMMRQKKYTEALKLFLKAREHMAGLPLAEADRQQLERRISACRKALADADD